MSHNNGENSCRRLGTLLCFVFCRCSVDVFQSQFPRIFLVRSALPDWMYTMGGKLTYTSAGLKGHYQAPDPLCQEPIPLCLPERLTWDLHMLYIFEESFGRIFLFLIHELLAGVHLVGNNSDQRTFLALSLLMIYFTNAPTQLSCTTLGMRRRLRSSVYVQKRVNFSQKKNSCQEKVPPWYKRETLPSVLVALPGDLLYGEAPPERGLQVYVRQGFSSLEVYKRVGKSVILVCKRIRRV